MNGKTGSLIKFALFTLLFFALSRGCVNYEVYPFAFAMLFALAWANQKVYLLAPSYIIGFVANNFSLQGGVVCLVTIFSLGVPYYIHVACKAPVKKWELFVYALLSQSGYLAFALAGGSGALPIVLTFIFGLAFLFFAISIFEPLIIRGTKYRLTIFECVSGAFVLMALADSLAGCDIAGFSMLKLCISFCLLAISHSSSLSKANLFTLIMGLGTLIRANNPVFVAPFVIWALCLSIFRLKNKIFPFLTLICGEMLSIFYFNLYYSTSLLTCLPVIIGALIFLCLPQGFYSALGVLLNENNDRLAVKNVVNRNREILYRRLGKLAEVFNDMNTSFKELIKKSASEEEVKEMIYEEIKGSVCSGCKEAKHCHRTFCEDTHKIFKELVTISFERGKITILDMPGYLSSRCGKVNYLISQVNTLAKQYKSYSALVGNVDTSKLLIADQLEGMAGLMKVLAREVETEISFDSRREGKLIEELSSSNIICTDALVFEKDARTSMASLVVREEDVNKLKLPQIASKICGGKMAISEAYPSVRLGLVNVFLKSAPKFDCIFGLASIAKSGNTISGDCHSIERLDGDKFIFALCDGMGNGEEAGRKSARAISLVENFYKVGFDNEVILSSINRLLNLERDDLFSTIDICMIDLHSGIADFVKMGATSSFVRDEDGCQIIESGALPIGVLPEVKPLIKKIVLGGKQFVIMCSDGISDTFGSDDDMRDFIYTIKSANPQEFADEILSRALANNNGYAVDDMTVIVVKIF